MLGERVGLKGRSPTRTDDCCHGDQRKAVRGSQDGHEESCVCVCARVCA